MGSKAMLINAAHGEESRVAVVEDGYLQDLDIESSRRAQTKSNIFKATITKIEPSLQAAFVEYGSYRQGFLPLTEIHPDYWKEEADKTADPRKVSIADLVDRKQSLLVQVVKEERGTKGAALTTYISLAGRYIVLSPNTDRGGISRKLSDEDRKAMKHLLAQLEVPENMGLIIRTAGKDQELSSLERDFSYLKRLWSEITTKAEDAPSPALIYQDGDLATRAIRDHFSDEITEVWVDDQDIYRRTKDFMSIVLPGKEKLVKLHRGKTPLLRHMGVEAQCNQIHEREIRLPSGGSIVIDTTEALTSVDINSSRSTNARHIDDTALATNLEAAKEIARQMRIRDIGGLIVIDFIDMVSRKHSQDVETTLKNACAPDKARIQMARISRFGLLEMSRQRLHPSVRDATTHTCPRCSGRGRIRTVESIVLHMISRLEDFAAEGNKPTICLQAPVQSVEYIINAKMDEIQRIQKMYEVDIQIQIRTDIDVPHYRIERQWADGNQARMDTLEDTTKPEKQVRGGRRLKQVEPIVGIPTIEDSKPTGLLTKIAKLFKPKESTKKKTADEKEKQAQENPRSNQRGNRPAGQGNRRRRPQQRRSNRPNQARHEQARTASEDNKPDADNKPASEVLDSKIESSNKPAADTSAIKTEATEPTSTDKPQRPRRQQRNRRRSSSSQRNSPEANESAPKEEQTSIPPEKKEEQTTAFSE